VLTSASDTVIFLAKTMCTNEVNTMNTVHPAQLDTFDSIHDGNKKILTKNWNYTRKNLREDIFL